MRLAPRFTLSLVLTALAGGAAAQTTFDVPLDLWRHPNWPDGLNFGATNGVSLGDYDGDGWVDLFSAQSGQLWRNVNGQDWVLAADLTSILTPAVTRYGSSFADYDKDGILDIGIEPRDVAGGDTCFRLLRGLGGGPNFAEVSTDPLIVDTAICAANSETICWGDVDGDGNLDMFLPIYPPTPCGVLFGPGNAFLYNLGPVGPGGAYAFTEMAVAAGLDNPIGACRPEGGQMVDTDFDGDLEIYTGGGLYRNLSVPGTPLFELNTANAGIQFVDERDEGVAFIDMDMDGDQDLVISYIEPTVGVRVYEARGDGSYVLLPESVVESHLEDIKLGLTYADWDNDGDIDITTRARFRRNTFFGTGNFSFVNATDGVDDDHLGGLVSAWGDWDRDGDLDCVIAAFQGEAWMYENELYSAQTADADRRYVRVRAVGDSSTVAAGIEDQYGAVVELDVLGDPLPVRRRQMVSSSSGYLNQNEYTLHFGLPEDPVPANPAIDLIFDVSVDFPGTPDQGLRRIDKRINPALGSVRFVALQDREITVFRSGKVIFDGKVFDPLPLSSPLLITTNEGLQTPTAAAPVAAVTAAPADRFVGIEVNTLGAVEPVRVTEVIFDGEAKAPLTCGQESGNIIIWDVTKPGSPVFVAALEAPGVSTAFSTNDRTYLPCNVLLDPGGVYRIVASVASQRPSDLVSVPGPIQVTGGLIFADVDPCTGAAVEAEALLPTQVPMAIRYEAAPSAPFVDLGFGVTGVTGVPVLSGTGSPEADLPITIDLSNAAPNAPVGFFIGSSIDPIDLWGGVVVPALDGIIGDAGVITDATGSFSLPTLWPSSIGAGNALIFQVAVLDLAAPELVSVSNALAVVGQR